MYCVFSLRRPHPSQLVRRKWLTPVFTPAAWTQLHVTSRWDVRLCDPHRVKTRDATTNPHAPAPGPRGCPARAPACAPQPPSLPAPLPTTPPPRRPPLTARTRAAACNPHRHHRTSAGLRLRLLRPNERAGVYVGPHVREPWRAPGRGDRLACAALKAPCAESSPTLLPSTRGLEVLGEVTRVDGCLSSHQALPLRIQYRNCEHRSTIGLDDGGAAGGGLPHRVRAAGIRPHGREGDFVRRALLQQKPA